MSTARTPTPWRCNGSDREPWNMDAHAVLAALEERTKMQWRHVCNMERTARAAGYDPRHSDIYLAELSVLVMLLAIRRAGRRPR